MVDQHDMFIFAGMKAIRRKKQDPPKAENDNMAIIYMMMQDGASYDEIQNFANNAGNKKSNYSFNQRTGEVGVQGEDGKFRRLDKKAFDSASGGQYQGLWNRK